MSANPDFVYTPPQTPYLHIVYRDNDLIVLNKSSGLLTVPGRLPEHKDCLENRIKRVLPSATVVHRLDMATSGIIVMALNKPAHVAISQQFEKRKTQKQYIARVFGHVKEPQGVIEQPLICDWPNRPKQKIDHENGKPSTTHYQVLSYGDNSTLVELTPITGRSHQLRVHMLSLGHPILGDRLYAHTDALNMSNRLNLHAQTLSLYHPITNEFMTFSVEYGFE